MSFVERPVTDDLAGSRIAGIISYSDPCTYSWSVVNGDVHVKYLLIELKRMADRHVDDLLCKSNQVSEDLRYFHMLGPGERYQFGMW